MSAVKKEKKESSSMGLEHSTVEKVLHEAVENGGAYVARLVRCLTSA